MTTLFRPLPKSDGHYKEDRRQEGDYEEGSRNQNCLQDCEQDRSQERP